MAFRSYTVPYLVSTGSTNILLVSGQIRCVGTSWFPGSTNVFQVRSRNSKYQHVILMFSFIFERYIKLSYVVGFDIISVWWIPSANTIVHLPSLYRPVTEQQFPLCVFWPPVRTDHGCSGIPRPECFHKKTRFLKSRICHHICII